MKSVLVSLLCMMSLTASLVQAQTNPAQDRADKSKYFKVSAIEVQDLGLSEPAPIELKTLASTAGADCATSSAPGTFNKPVLQKLSEGTPISIDQIINLGMKIWNIVAQGKPVVNVKTDVATALPQGSRCWLDLQGWSRPQAHNYLAVMKNGFGSEVVRFKYQVISVSGGNLDGHGQYIGYATMVPVEINVSWGFTFNASGLAPTVMNMGTKMDPVAGMMLTMKYSVETPVQTLDFAQNYFLDGTGKIESME